MPFSIAGPAYSSLPSLDGINRASERISSGIQADYEQNAAEAAIAGRLDTAVGESTVAIRNATSQISALQKSDNTLAQATDQITRLQELAVQSENGALSETDQQALREEANQLVEALSDTVANASFNGQSLFDAAEIDADELQQSVDELKNSGDPLNQEALAAVQEDVTSLRAEAGAKENAVVDQISTLEQNLLATSESRSRVKDADLATEIVNLIQEEIQFKAEVKVFNQQRLAEESVLRLLTS